jgi:hypothetical protein
MSDTRNYGNSLSKSSNLPSINLATSHNFDARSEVNNDGKVLIYLDRF